MSEQTFRDHLSTVDSEGKRKWIFPKKPFGPLYKWRKVVSYVLLAFLFITPYLQINGHPFMMMNIFQRKFIIFGQVFWPQDFHLFLLAVLIFIVFIIFFTVIFGRVWCGWACPQTIFMEMVFRRIEYWIEGDYMKQKKLDKMPWNQEKILKKGSKHAIFLFISFAIGNTLMAFLVGRDQLFEIVSKSPTANLSAFIGVIGFTVVFYWVYSSFREQICTIVCPYGRLQGALLDQKSIVVAYDNKRGEPREKNTRNRAEDAGDCIDCHQCVDVCPTGIDIRNGTQLECINCTACIDACNNIMEKVNKPKGLIRYESESNIEKKEKFKFTPRMIAYSFVLTALLFLMGFMLTNRSDTETSLLRTQGSLYTQEGSNYKNLFKIKILNKTLEERPIELKLEKPIEGRIYVAGNELVAPSEGFAEGILFVELPESELEGKNTEVKIGLYSKGELIETLETNFIGPGK